MKKLFSICLATVLLCSLTVLAEDNPERIGRDDHPSRSGHHDDSPSFQTSCPVMGKAIDRSLFVDYDGRRIYVCCAGCIDKVKAEPEKYLNTMKANGQTPYVTQTLCPISGEAINRTVFSDTKTQRVYFCCETCKSSFDKNPEKNLKDLESKGIALETTPTR